jgi:DNA adenine methylase
MPVSTSREKKLKNKTHNLDISRPFLKWVGGKTQIINDILEHIPKTINNYHEPFLGGGSVLLAVLSQKATDNINITGKIYASDLNRTLISLYRNIQTNPDDLIVEVKRLTDEFAMCNTTDPQINRNASSLEDALTSPESYYYWVRSKFNLLPKTDRTTIPASAMILFMNKTCFRGLYREGPNGFNVPYGNYKNPSIMDEEHIRHISQLIKDVVFTDCPFSEAFTRIIPGDFMYLDPPYAPETSTSFVSYTSVGFDTAQHKSLFAHCNELKKNNITMLMSNAYVSLVKDAFPAPLYTTKIISCKRSINSKDPGLRTNEALITN